jgi:hypothetical protein
LSSQYDPLPEGTKPIEQLEAKALEIIKSRGDEGVYQHELWRTLGLDSREGSRLALRLLKKGLIVREPVVHNGRRTYKLYIAKQVKRSFKIDVDFTPFLEVPCFTCPHMGSRCFEGGFFDPRNCPMLREWLDKRVRVSRKSLVAKSL